MCFFKRCVSPIIIGQKGHLCLAKLELWAFPQPTRGSFEAREADDMHSCASIWEQNHNEGTHQKILQLLVFFSFCIQITKYEKFQSKCIWRPMTRTKIRSNSKFKSRGVNVLSWLFVITKKTTTYKKKDVKNKLIQQSSSTFLRHSATFLFPLAKLKTFLEYFFKHFTDKIKTN